MPKIKMQEPTLQERQHLDLFFRGINERLGNSIIRIKSNKPIVGRRQELTDLSMIMRRKDTPVAGILGPAGTGKSALVTAWKDDEAKRDGKYREVFQLKLGMMAADGQEMLKARMNSMMERLGEYQDELRKFVPHSEVILFIDEVHMIVSIFGQGSKIGGDLLKESLARAEEFIKVITATTNEEYDRYIASDKPLARRFKTISLQELSQDETFEVLRGWLASKSEKGNDLNAKIDDDTLRLIIRANRLYREDFHEPAKSIDTLATIESIHSYEGIPMDRDLVVRAFRTQYDVRIDFDVDHRHVYRTVVGRVKGQPMALYAIDRMSKRLAFQLKIDNRPRYVALFAGTTGTGKSVLLHEKVPFYTNGKLDFKNHGDLQPGDYVFGRHGKPVKVIANYPQGKLPAYKVHFADGTSVICNDEHLWTYKHSSGNGGKHWKTTELKNLIEKGISRIEKTGRTVNKFKIPNNEAAQSEDREYLTDPYVVGAFIGNGVLGRSQLEFSSDDKYVDEKIKELIGSTEVFYQSNNYSLNFRLPEGVSTQHKNFQTKDVFKEIPELINTYSHEKFIPEIYKLGSIEQRWEVVRGLFDTDGSITYAAGRYNVKYSTTSLKLAEDLKEVLASLGFMSTIISTQRDTREGTQNREYNLSVKAQNKDKHLFFSTPKKKELALEAARHVKAREKVYDSVPIVKVEDLGEEMEMNCIMVDDPEHLYCVTKNFIVTHNTETVKALAESVFGDEKALINISMTDYAADGSDGRFRRILGTQVRHKPSAVVLLDELEKSSKDVRNVLLPVLDEGIMKFTDIGADGHEVEFTVSFKNTIIIATSNAGAETMAEISKYSKVEAMGTEWNDQMKENSQKIEDTVIKALGTAGLRPEFLQRFETIVSFDKLSEHTLREIAHLQLFRLLKEMRDVKGYDVRIPRPKDWSSYGYRNPDGSPVIADEITMFIVHDRMNTTDANQSGARKIRSIINRDIQGALIDEFLKPGNEEKRKYNMKTNGRARFEDRSSAVPRGGIIVEAKD